MSEEVRTTSATGGQKGVKSERHSLLPRKGLDAIARVFGFGAEKYAAHNWRKRYEWSKSLDALERHIGAFMDGETYDPESGLPHLAHAGFHILVLLTWLEEDGEGVDNPMDDRWPAGLERARIQETLEKATSSFVANAVWTGPSSGSVTLDDITVSREVDKRLGDMISEKISDAEVDWQDPKALTRYQIQDSVNGIRAVGFTTGIPPYLRDPYPEPPSPKSFVDLPVENLRGLTD